MTKNRRRIFLWTLPGAGGALVAGTAAVVILGHHATAATPVSQTAAQPVILDAAAGESFTPSITPPATLAKTAMLSVSDARAAASDNAISPPADAAVQTGYLTFPVGPGAPNAYHAKNAYAYAFTWASCQPGGLGEAPPAKGQAPTAAAPQNCTQWVIIDAKTGEALDITWTE